MDVRVTFNPNVLTVVSASLGHTIWDLNNNGIISDDPVLVVRHDVFPTIGLIRYALTFVGGVSVSPSAPASMLDINYIVNNPPGLTATDLPSMVSMQSAALVV